MSDKNFKFFVTSIMDDPLQLHLDCQVESGRVRCCRRVILEKIPQFVLKLSHTKIQNI